MRSLRFRHFRTYGQQFVIRSCGNKNSELLPKPLPLWIEKFNMNVQNSPTITTTFFVAMRVSSWHLSAFLCSQLLDLGPELAVGYAVAKLTAKFRQPINIALAGVLSHLFPILQQIKVSPLIAFPSNNSKSPSGEASDSWFEKLTLWIEGPIDKYGSSLLLSGRISSVLTIFTASYLLHHGLDLNTYLSSLGISETLQEVSGSLAAASIVNSCLLPWDVWFTSNSTPKISGLFPTTNNNK